MVRAVAREGRSPGEEERRRGGSEGARVSRRARVGSAGEQLRVELAVPAR